MRSGPPDFALDDLDFKASIDYVKVSMSPTLRAEVITSGVAKWTRDKSYPDTAFLTIHDPDRRDVQLVTTTCADPTLWEMEVAVDLSPKQHVAAKARRLLLESTFRAVAGRLRPEDATPWGFGLRGGTTGRGTMTPFHERLPSHTQQLLYGHRGEFQQVKVYLKARDNGKGLRPEQHRVRIEVRLRRNALMERGLDRISGLFGFQFRRELASTFRLIDRPFVRVRSQRSASATQQLEIDMLRKWGAAGVGAFAPKMPLPLETDSWSRERISFRAKHQLAVKDFRLARHVAANRRIAGALRLLDKRMA